MKVIIYKGYDDYQNPIVDYGVNSDTLEIVVLPQENWNTFIKDFCIFDLNLQEFVLKD